MFMVEAELQTCGQTMSVGAFALAALSTKTVPVGNFLKHPSGGAPAIGVVHPKRGITHLQRNGCNA
jgi:hypothetical protein